MDLRQNEVVGVVIAFHVRIVETVVLAERALVIQDLHDGSAADPVLLDQVLVQLFAEVDVSREIVFDILRQLCVDFR